MFFSQRNNVKNVLQTANNQIQKKEKRNEKQGKLKTMNIKVFNKKKILFIAKTKKKKKLYVFMINRRK